MKQEPCAFVPTKAGARELLKLTRDLRIITDNEVQPVLPDGTRTISTFPLEQTEDFPVTIDRQNNLVAIPDLFVDFFNFYHFPPQTVRHMPPNGTHWLRMVITATCDATKAVDNWYPPEATVNTPTLEWWEEAGSIPLTDPFPPVYTSTEYYAYILKITDGVLVETRASRFIWGGPKEVFGL